jgi:putative oxidoreductase
MKKYLPLIAGIVLGLLFIMASTMFFLKLGPKPEFPEGSPIAHYMAAFGPTGLMHFVKVFELFGGILVAIPRTRNFGLLVLGPIIVNIIGFHIFVTGPKELLNPMLDVIIACALYLLWVGRKQFAGLLNGKEHHA